MKQQCEISEEWVAQIQHADIWKSISDVFGRQNVFIAETVLKSRPSQIDSTNQTITQAMTFRKRPKFRSMLCKDGLMVWSLVFVVYQTAISEAFCVQKNFRSWTCAECSWSCWPQSSLVLCRAVLSQLPVRLPRTQHTMTMTIMMVILTETPWRGVADGD